MRGKKMRPRFLLLFLLSVSVVAATLFIFVSQTHFELENSVSGPYRNDSREKPIVSAKAFLVLAVSPEGKSRVLLGRAINAELPIASITKLFTASVSRDIFAESQAIRVPESASRHHGDYEELTPGDTYYLKDLLSALLIESNNDAAQALFVAGGGEAFVARMNARARSWGLLHTQFVNPTGLDGAAINHSTAEDVAVAMIEILKTEPDIVHILGKSEATICDAAQMRCFSATTTNALLLDSSFPMRIIGGKTGDTALAKKNLVLATQAPLSGWTLISVVLGSGDHFADTKKLFEWVEASYKWK